MKLQLFVGIFFSLVSVSLFAESGKSNEDWKLVAFTKTSTTFFNPKQILKDRKYKKTWIREISLDYKSLTKTLVRADCVAHTLRMSSYLKYDSNGNFLSSKDLGSPVMEVPPESLGGLILKSICTGKGYKELNN